MKSEISNKQSQIKIITSQPLLYELGLGVFVICFILTSLLFWQYTHSVLVNPAQPAYYTLDQYGQITPLAATTQRPDTEVMGQSVERTKP